MQQNEQAFHLGTQRLDITPPVGTYLAGFASRNRPCDGVYHPLSGVVSYLDDGKTSLLLVSMEWLGIYDLTAPLRQALSDATGIVKEHVFLTATHTHCGPALPRDVDIRRHKVIDYDYLKAVTKKLAAAAKRAMGEKQRVRLYYGEGWCGFSASRRSPAADGGVQWKPTLDAAHDHRVPVLVAKTHSNRLHTVFFNYACHPTGAGDINKIGGGYVGFAYDFLKTAYPAAESLFFQGGGGDQKPNAPDPVDGSFRRLSVAEIKTLGFRLGHSVKRLIDTNDLYEIKPPFGVRDSRIKVNSEVPTQNELKQALQHPDSSVQTWAKHNLDRLQAGKALACEHDLEIQSVIFDSSLALIALAGEITVELALNIQRCAENIVKRAMIVGYSNNIIGYITSRRQLKEGGYEVTDFARNWLLSGRFCDDTEAKIIERIIKDLQFQE